MLVFADLAKPNGTTLSSIDPNWTAEPSLILQDGHLQDNRNYRTGVAYYKVSSSTFLGVVFRRGHLKPNLNAIALDTSVGSIVNVAVNYGYGFSLAPGAGFLSVTLSKNNSFLTQFRVSGADAAKYDPGLFDIKVKIERSIAPTGAMFRCYMAAGLNGAYAEIELNGGGLGFVDTSPLANTGVIGFAIGNDEINTVATHLLAIDADVFMTSAASALPDRHISRGIARGFERGIV
jgi:hypothetical protein